MARINLWSRFGNILYYIVAEYKNITDFDRYFDAIFAQDWQKYIPEGYEIVVNATSLKSELGAIPTLQGLAKKAIVKKIQSSLTPLNKGGSFTQ
jgi:putative N6-adenine-specific DNA methylase